MKHTKSVARSTLILGLIGLVFGCVVAPREGYYDGEHHRYWHENGWHECHEGDSYCR